MASNERTHRRNGPALVIKVIIGLATLASSTSWPVSRR